MRAPSSDQIAEQHGELPAFGNVMRLRLGGRGPGAAGTAPTSSAIAASIFRRWPEQDADVLEDLVGQDGGYRDIDSFSQNAQCTRTCQVLLSHSAILRHQRSSDGLIIPERVSGPQYYITPFVAR